MMSTILKQSFSLLLFAIIIHGDLQRELVTMAKRNQTINGLYRPVVNGFINRGGFGFIFKGERCSDNKSVAMKFVHADYIESARREYDMYWYLNAINNTNVEKYGFSTVYYFKHWQYYVLMVFPLFECDLKNKMKRYTFQPIDNLILFRDFVRQSKYMHANGIRHDDIKPENIMIKKGRSFLIDLNVSSKMGEFNKLGAIQFKSRRGLHEQLRNGLDDWESFLYTMCYVNKVDLWFSHSTPQLREQRDQIHETIARIESTINPEIKDIFVAFARECFKENNSIPRYDHFEKLITDKIQDLADGSSQLATFAWLTPAEKSEAAIDSMNNPPYTTENIADPKINPKSIQYNLPVNYNFFN